MQHPVFDTANEMQRYFDADIGEFCVSFRLAYVTNSRFIGKSLRRCHIYRLHTLGCVSYAIHLCPSEWCLDFGRCSYFGNLSFLISCLVQSLWTTYIVNVMLWNDMGLFHIRTRFYFSSGEKNESAEFLQLGGRQKWDFWRQEKFDMRALLWIFIGFLLQ